MLVFTRVKTISRGVQNSDEGKYEDVIDSVDFQKNTQNRAVDFLSTIPPHTFFFL